MSSGSCRSISDSEGGTIFAVMDTMYAAEIARFLGVTNQRAHQITRTDPTFPRPVETDPHRRWKRAAVERWAEAQWWGTRPWRQPPSDSQAG